MCPVYLTPSQGAVHLVAKPQKPNHNRPDTSKGAGNREAEVGEAGWEKEGRGGKQEDKSADPPAEGENKQRSATRPERGGCKGRQKRNKRVVRSKGTGMERPLGGKW